MDFRARMVRLAESYIDSIQKTNLEAKEIKPRILLRDIVGSAAKEVSKIAAAAGRLSKIRDPRTVKLAARVLNKLDYNAVLKNRLAYGRKFDQLNRDPSAFSNKPKSITKNISKLKDLRK